MGQRISQGSANPAQPGTFFLWLRLSCDGDAETRINPLWQCVSSEFSGTDFIEMAGRATADGWRRRNGKWYSSCCCRIPKGISYGDD